jgi:hypothetical protein
MTEDDLEQSISHYFAVTGPALVSYFDLVHEYDRRQAWKADGARNVAEWLAGRFDLSPATAHADARLARRLAERPRLRQALADGELSLDKVRQLSRVTPQDAQHHDDDTLVSFAVGCTYAQLRALCHK